MSPLPTLEHLWLLSAQADVVVALSFRYNEGISDIKGKVTLEGEPKVVYKSDALGIETTLHRLSVDRGLSWKDAKTIYDKARAEEAAARRRARLEARSPRGRSRAGSRRQS